MNRPPQHSAALVADFTMRLFQVERKNEQAIKFEVSHQEEVSSDEEDRQAKKKMNESI